jgi:hypothetical protein
VLVTLLNTKANENGIVTPTGGTGNLNTYWASDGMLNYKVVNGLCIISFNINLKIPTQEGAVLITQIPYCKLKVYEYFVSDINSTPTIYYVEDNALKCGVGAPGRYIGCMAYPTV